MAQEVETARRETVSMCLAQHTDGQKLRKDGKLVEARAAFKQCSIPGCPDQIIRDCIDWSEQVDKQMPSIGFNVTADGVPRTDVQVFVDGSLIASKLEGKALELNPGIHRARVVLPGFDAIETEFVASEGVKFHVIEVPFKTAAPSGPAEVEMHRPIPASAYVFAAVGTAAAISGAGWGIATMSLRSELEASCKHNCQTEAVNVLKQRALFTDVSWGVSIASFATAATLYFLRPEKPLVDNVEVDVALTPGGAYGTVSVSEF